MPKRAILGSPKTSATILLFPAAVSGDRSIIWGALGHDINLTIPNFRVTDTDDVRWEKGRSLVAQFKGKTAKPFQQTEAFEILKNGALQIKTLRREDNGTYNVMVYGADGSSKLQKAFDLRVLGESSLSEVSPFQSGCYAASRGAVSL